MVKTWKHDSAIPLELLDVEPTWESTRSFEDPLDAYQLELFTSSPFHIVFYVATATKKVGDREALRYRLWDRGRSQRYGWQMDAQ